MWNNQLGLKCDRLKAEDGTQLLLQGTTLSTAEGLLPFQLDATTGLLKVAAAAGDAPAKLQFARVAK